MNNIAHMSHAELDRLTMAQDRRHERPLALDLTFFNQCSAPVPKDWIIKGVIAKGESSSWFGAPGRLKSALLTDIAVHAGAAMDWRGYRAKQGCGVVYFAMERADLVKRRLAAYAQRDGFDRLPIAVASTVINLMHKSCVDIISATIARAADQFGGSVGLIILDTVSKGIAAGGGDEDKAKDQNIVAANLRRIHEQWKLHIAGIGHSGKDEGRGERGSNARLADVDLQVHITGDDIKTATTVKANDAAEGPLTAFQSERIELGTDEDGDPFTAFIVGAERVDGVAADRTRAASPTKAAQIALRALSEELADGGQSPPTSPHIPANLLVIPVSAWRQRAYRMGISTGEERAKQIAFQRASQWLIGNQRVAVWDDLAWLPR